MVTTAFFFSAGLVPLKGSVPAGKDERLFTRALPCFVAWPDANRFPLLLDTQDRPDIVKRREEWFGGQLDLDPEKLVFIAETWTTTNMARKCGRAPKGERLRAGIPHGGPRA